MITNSQKVASDMLLKLKLKAELEAKLKSVNQAIAEQEGALFDRMIDEGVNSITVDGIEFKPIVQEDYALLDGSRTWDDSPNFFKWLHTIGESALIKTKESVHYQTRNSFLKEYVKGGNPLPEFIKEKFYNTVKYNKSAVKRLVGGSNEE